MKKIEQGLVPVITFDLTYELHKLLAGKGYFELINEPCYRYGIISEKLSDYPVSWKMRSRALKDFSYIVKHGYFDTENIWREGQHSCDIVEMS